MERVAIQHDKAYQFALRYLTARPRTIREVNNLLSKKGFAPELIEHIIKRLIDQRLLDDRDFALSWIDFRNQTRPTGQRLLKIELKMHGVMPDVINEVVDNNTQDELTLARQALAVRFKKTNVEYQKALEFLVRRGFDYAIAREAVKTIP